MSLLSGKRDTVLALTAVVVVVAVAVGLWVNGSRGPKDYRITAHFTSSTGIYAGDEVTVLGVPVGTVEKVEPRALDVVLTLRVKGNVTLPQNVGAAMVAQSLVAGRTVALTPAYTTGATLPRRASIPLGRTTVPMEWDDIKNALSDVTKAVGPHGDDPGSAATLVSTGADAFAPNAQNVNDTIGLLSDAMSTISDGRADLFAVVRNLQVFVTAMRGSNDQVAELHRDLAAVTSVLGDNRKTLGEAVTAVDSVLTDVTGFVQRNRDKLSGNVASLTTLSQVLADQRTNIEGIMHQAPTQVVNFYNIYKPALGVMTGVFAAPNFENPIHAVCGGLASVGQPNSRRAADLCVQHLGTYLRTLTTTYPNILTSPSRSSFSDPGQLVESVPGVLDSVPGITGAPARRTTVPKNLRSLLLGEGSR